MEIICLIRELRQAIKNKLHSDEKYKMLILNL